MNLNIIENSRSATRTCIQKIKKWGPTGKPHLKQYDRKCIAKKKQSPKQETVTNLLILLDSFHCPSRQALRVGSLVSRLSHCQFPRSIPQNMTCRSHLSLFLTCWCLKQESIQSLINVYSQLQTCRSLGNSVCYEDMRTRCVTPTWFMISHIPRCVHAH